MLAIVEIMIPAGIMMPFKKVGHFLTVQEVNRVPYSVEKTDITAGQNNFYQ